MRYGCCVNMVTQMADVSGTDVLPVLKEIGYDYAELSLSHLCALDEEHFRNVCNDLLSVGLPVEVCNNFFPPSLSLISPSVDINLIKEYLEKAFRRAIELGIKVIVFGSGGARSVPENIRFTEAFQRLVQILRLINSYATSHKILIAIEPLRKNECNIINTYSEALILADMSNCSNVHCPLDIFHLFDEKENISVIEKKPERLVHVHFAEPKGRIFPIEANKKYYSTIVQHIMQTGYNQRISIEAYSKNFRNDASKALRLMKSIEEEIKNKKIFLKH